ncbi:MAG: phosphoribosylanthranilate isomerase [Formosimonas sp.]
MRTRVKFCGFTRAQDVQTAVRLGVDALGFVFYPPSPRYLTPQNAAALLAHVPAFISTVGLFVNESLESMQNTLRIAPMSMIQLHGDESWDFALHVQHILQKPIIKAVRVNPQTDWDEVAQHAEQVAGVLLDADAVGYGGAGHVFDWSVIPTQLRHKIILSGGLKLENIQNAIRTVQPYALDVSSGIEAGVKGVKDASQMAAFIQALTAGV